MSLSLCCESSLETYQHNNNSDVYNRVNLAYVVYQMLFFSLGRQNSFIQHNYEVTGQKRKQNIYVAEFDFSVFYSLGSTCNYPSITYGDSAVFPRIIPGDSLRSADAFPVVASLRGREATTGNASALRRLTRGRLLFFFAPAGGDYSRESIMPAYRKSFPTYFVLLSLSNKKIISSNKLSMGF